LSSMQDELFFVNYHPNRHISPLIQIYLNAHITKFVPQFKKEPLD